MPDPEVRAHAPDGIEEYDNPLPRWWLGLFYLTIVFAVGYCIAYPSLPNWNGTLAWSSSGQYDQQVAVWNQAHPAPPAAPEADTGEDLKKLSQDPKMVAEGHEIFEDNCAVCHGPEGRGKIGPSLHGPTFRYGGDSKTILFTIRNGRPGGMPTWKKLLEPDEILKVGSFVYSLRYEKKSAVPTTETAVRQ